MSIFTNKPPLLQRIERQLKHFPKLSKKIPVHPDDLKEALRLRHEGLIPNVYIKALGGSLFPPISCASTGGDK